MKSGFECPPDHPHNTNCYRRHGCRCTQCRAVCAESQRTYLANNPKKRRELAHICQCGCGTRIKGRWVKGHNPGPRRIKPAGMTFERALEIANGAPPRERDIP